MASTSGGASSSKRKRRDYTDYARVKAELESLGWTVVSTEDEIAQKIKDGKEAGRVKWSVTRTDEAGTPVDRTAEASNLLNGHTKGLSSAERSAAHPFKPGETGHFVRENDAIFDVNAVLSRYVEALNAGRGGDDDDDDDDTVSFRVTGEEGTRADAICGPDDECRGMQMTVATWKDFSGKPTINKSAQDIVRHLERGFVFVAACYVNAELVGAYLVVPSEVDIVRQFTFQKWHPTLFPKRKTPEKAKDGPPQQMKQFLSLWKTSADGLVNEDVQRAFANKLYNFVTDPKVKLYTKDEIDAMLGKSHAMEKAYMDALMKTPGLLCDGLTIERVGHQRGDVWFNLTGQDPFLAEAKGARPHGLQFLANIRKDGKTSMNVNDVPVWIFAVPFRDRNEWYFLFVAGRTTDGHVNVRFDSPVAQKVLFRFDRETLIVSGCVGRIKDTQSCVVIGVRDGAPIDGLAFDADKIERIADMARRPAVSQDEINSNVKLWETTKKDTELTQRRKHARTKAKKKRTAELEAQQRRSAEAEGGDEEDDEDDEEDDEDDEED